MMVLGWLRRLTGGRDEPEEIPDLNLVDADVYLGNRSSQRAPVQIGVDQCFASPKDGGQERWLPITIVDLSLGGARIVATEAVTSGERMRLRFKLPKGHGEWHGTGFVTWTSTSGLLAGMKFNPAADRKQEAASDRLKRYVAATAPASAVN